MTARLVVLALEAVVACGALGLVAGSSAVADSFQPSMRRVLGSATSAGTVDEGRFLVAGRRISDPNFSKTVVLILRHAEQGTLGVIVNRRTETRPTAVLPEVKGLKRHKDNVYTGGPVQRDRFLVLLRSDDPPQGFSRVFDDVYVGDSREALERVAREKKLRRDYRIYAGFAGWAPGQLAHEMDRGDWHILTADQQSVFAENPAELWRQLVPPIRELRPDLVTSVLTEGGQLAPSPDFSQRFELRSLRCRQVRMLRRFPAAGVLLQYV